MYSINLDSSFRDSMNYIKGLIKRDFNIEDDYNIEIVEAGNPDNENGHDAELSPAIQISHNYTLREYYGNNYVNIAFYIRKVQSNSTPYTNIIEDDESIS
jgi:hypothetical protein